MKIFISGKVTGDLWYREKFQKIEDMLVNAGHVVVNPSFLPDGLGEHSDYMDICIAMLDKCDGIYLLSDWEDSQGARIEARHAQQKGMKIWYQDRELPF